ncbi:MULTISPECIES: hypothetical protein [unclassified Streptomyces]|uniref:hypothetical protein n=1 Tax=unclassified Streptomyces TaxID=2593676 RepID=UPI0029ADF8E2|nr:MULTISPECIES: hypothetical protein [unclassified Streptomyces]MDX3771197.1 hypothetical protein [Streptomyces sp. AK08-01B]MDX3820763.1 hypothetical protein [Streptomyces sp. AK08-01A]
MSRDKAARLGMDYTGEPYTAAFPLEALTWNRLALALQQLAHQACFPRLEADQNLLFF